MAWRLALKLCALPSTSSIDAFDSFQAGFGRMAQDEFHYCCGADPADRPLIHCALIRGGGNTSGQKN